MLFFLFTIVITSFAFEGAGAGLFLGTGTPSSINAADDLSEDLGINEEKGNFSFGALGFYQAPTYRLGASFQFQAWAGWNTGDDNAQEESAGLAAFTAGLYGTYSFYTGRILLNIGGVVGAGRVSLGYNLNEERGDIKERDSVSTFYIEPQISFGIATCRWVGVEFQLSSPIYFLDDELKITLYGNEYSVDSNEMIGITFSMKLLFGVIAEI